MLNTVENCAGINKENEEKTEFARNCCAGTYFDNEDCKKIL